MSTFSEILYTIHPVDYNIVFPQNGLYKPQTDYVQDDTGIPILRIDAFYNGKVTNWNTLKRLICSETEIDRYLLKENDIVINRVNSIEYLGKCAHIVGLKEKTDFEEKVVEREFQDFLHLLDLYLLD